MHLKPSCGSVICVKARLGFMIRVRQAISSAMSSLKIGICELGTRKTTNPVEWQTVPLESNLSDFEYMHLIYDIMLCFHRKAKMHISFCATTLWICESSGRKCAQIRGSLQRTYSTMRTKLCDSYSYWIQCIVNSSTLVSAMEEVTIAK